MVFGQPWYPHLDDGSLSRAKWIFITPLSPWCSNGGSATNSPQSTADTDYFQQRPIVGGFIKKKYKAGAILRAFNPYQAPYIILIQIGRVTITLHFWFSNPTHLLVILYFNMLMNALLTHKYTKGYSGSQIFSHISLYTLSIQKYTDILFGAENPFLHIKCIPTLPAHIHAYIDINARGSIGIIWPYRRPHIIIVLIYYIDIIRYAHPHWILAM